MNQEAVNLESQLRELGLLDESHSWSSIKLQASLMLHPLEEADLAAAKDAERE